MDKPIIFPVSSELDYLGGVEKHPVRGWTFGGLRHTSLPNNRVCHGSGCI